MIKRSVTTTTTTTNNNNNNNNNNDNKYNNQRIYHDALKYTPITLVLPFPRKLEVGASITSSSFQAYKVEPNSLSNTVTSGIVLTLLLLSIFSC